MSDLFHEVTDSVVGLHVEFEQFLMLIADDKGDGGRQHFNGLL